jgi:hypothetical protein
MSVSFNRNVSNTSLQRPGSNKSAGTEDSLGKPIGGLMRFGENYNDNHFDDEEGSPKDPFHDQRHQIEIRELNDEAIMWAKHALGELPLRTYAYAFDSGYLLQDILKTLRRYKIVYEWWIIQLPRLDVLQHLLEKHVPMAIKTNPNDIASPLTLTVFRMLLNRKHLLPGGVIGMVDPRIWSYDMPTINMKVVIPKLIKEKILTESLEIVEIPPREWFESQFGKDGGSQIRLYLWSRRNHVIADNTTPSSKKGLLWFVKG